MINDSKKIIWLNASLTQGGSERAMTLLANAFAEADINTKMVLLREGKEDTYPVSSKLDIIRFRYQTNNKFRILFKRHRQLRSLIKKERPDYIISFMWDINAFTLLSCLGLHQKVIISERNHPQIGGIVRKITNKWIYRLADCIVFQTGDAVKYYPKAVRDKSVIIPNPINPNLPDPYYGKRKYEIVSAGRFVEQKNFSMLIRSFSNFAVSHPDWKLTIYGKGPLYVSLQEEIRRLCIQNAVKLPGFVDDLPQSIRSAGIYVSSSNYEGISNVMLEAMALGLPCICTDCPVGGAAMAIQNGVNGILVPVGDQKAIAEAMCRIADDPVYSKELQMEAIKVRERFSINKIASTWMKLCGIQQGKDE